MKYMYDAFQLNNGVENPCIGFGTFKAADSKSAEIIRTAIDAGYRYFDTALSRCSFLARPSISLGSASAIL